MSESHDGAVRPVSMTAETLDHFLPGVMSPDTKRRLEIGEELISYLHDKQTSLYCEDMDKLADGLASWVSSSNFKVRHTWLRRSVMCFIDVSLLGDQNKHCRHSSVDLSVSDGSIVKFQIDFH